jgi:hypothetical protein
MTSQNTKKIEAQIIDAKRMFSTNQVLEIFGIKSGRFRQWIDLGYIRPDIKASGSGSTHYFEEYKLYIIGLFKNLVGLGLNRYISSWLAHSFDRGSWYDIASNSDPLHMVVEGDIDSEKQKDPGKFLKCRMDTNSLVDLQTYEVAIVLNLRKIIKEVENKII